MSAVLCGTGFMAWFAVVEAVTRRLRVGRETSRKFVHLTAGLAAAAMPLMLSFREIAVLGVLFALAMAASRRLGILGSIHGVERATWGEVCLPLGVAATATLLPHAALYTYAIVTLAVGDVAACLIGQRFGGSRRSLPGGTKTYVGSAAFFVTTLVIGMAMLPTLPAGGVTTLATVISVAAATTLVEAAAPHGLDNVAIPLTAAALLAMG